MIRSDNPGIKEAIQTIKEYGLRRVARAHYESWLKAKRDQYAMDKYVRETARAEGLAEGRREERQENIKLFIESFQELKVSKEDAQSKLEVKFSLSQEEAEEYISKYWQ